MTYCTHFYAECSATAMEFEIEIIFTCDEEEEREMFWGFPVSMPASGEVDIVEVFKNGEEWLDYPDAITKQLYDHEWTPCGEVQRRHVRLPISKPQKLQPCKKRLAA